MEEDFAIKEEPIEDFEYEYSPSNDLLVKAEITSSSSVHGNSRYTYEQIYKGFSDWKQKNNITETSEIVLLDYLNNLAEKYKPSSLWSQFSMLKSMIKENENIDIETFTKLKIFVRAKNKGYVKQKSNTFTAKEIERFLLEAPDQKYFATKVALIFGINGAMRACELVQLSIRHITFDDQTLQVYVPATKMEMGRSFTIDGKFFDIIKKYMNMRPENVSSDRFFVNYQQGKCTSRFIGKHKFEKMSYEIALFLRLQNAELYTGHAFRRTAATLLTQSGASLSRLKSLRGCKPDSTAQVYNDTISNKRKTSAMISMDINVDKPLTPIITLSDLLQSHKFPV